MGMEKDPRQVSLNPEGLCWLRTDAGMGRGPQGLEGPHLLEGLNEMCPVD